MSARPRGKGILPSMIGAILLVLAAYVAIDNARFASDARRVEGKITGLHEVPSGRRPSHVPIVRYRDESGKPHDIYARERDGPYEFWNVGDRIGVLYRPEHPEDGRVDGFGSLWVASLVMALAGGGLLAVGLRRLRTPRDQS